MAFSKTGPAAIRPHERLTQALRERIQSGVWQVGEMIPARRALAKEYEVALATVEKAVHTLISEGCLRADDRRGTFVAAVSDDNSSAQMVFGQAPCECTVGIIADIVPYESIEMRETQWSARIVRSCEQALSHEEGITLNFVNMVPEIGKVMTVEQAIEEATASGAQIVVMIGTNTEEFLELMPRKELPPIIHVCFDPIPAPISQIYVDSSVGGVLAVRHLRQRGFEHLVFLRPFVTSWVEDRLQGVKASLAGQPLQIYPDTPMKTFDPNKQNEMGRDLATRIFAEKLREKTAFIAPNDLVARGFMQQATQMGFKAGHDYGILGFDDRQREAQLTSLRPPLDQMGEEAARMALLQLRGANCPSRVALPHSLIARASTRLS